MVAHVRFFDESASGVRSPAVTLDLPGERTTTRELIRRRVEHEVALHNAKRDQGVFQGLVQPTGAEQALNGWRLKKPRALDPAAQVKIALEAFELHHADHGLQGGERVGGHLRLGGGKRA